MERVRIACVGLGAMGGPMAASIIRSGAEVGVYDVRPDAAQEYVEAGAIGLTTLAEVGAFSDIVAVVVVNDAQLDSVICGSEGQPGVLASMRPGALIVAHSTVTPSLCRRLAQQAAESGVGFVDAPISGGRQAAIDGILTIMVGGSEEHVAQCEPLFSAVANGVHHLGAVGAGQVGKLVNNMIGIATRVIVREGLELARSAGLDDDVVLDFVRQSSGSSWQVENWRTMQVFGESALGGPSGMAAIAQKDIDMALGLSAEYGLNLSVAQAAAMSVDGMFGPQA